MPKTIIDHEVCENAKKALIKIGRHGTTANKLKAVISAHTNGIKKVSEVFNVHATSIHRWAKQIRDNDIEGLVNKSKHQDGISLKKIHKDAIATWLKNDSNLSIKAVQEMVSNKFDVSVSKSTIHRAMRSVGFSYITPRKRHYKQDKEVVEQFKKKSSR